MIRLGKSVPVGWRPYAGEPVAKRILFEVVRTGGWSARRFERIGAASLRDHRGLLPELRLVGGRARWINERIGIQRTAALSATGRSTHGIAGPARGKRFTTG